MKKKIIFLTIIISIIACVSACVTIIIINQSKSVRIPEQKGLSSYQLAVEYGYDGSVQEWIDSVSDKSSYEIVEDNGIDKSENEWINLIDENSEKEIVKIKTAEVSQKGELIITLTDNTRINVGKTYGNDSQSTIKGIEVSDSNELIVVTDDSKKYNIGTIMGDKPISTDKENTIVKAEISDNGKLDITLDNGDKADSKDNQTNAPSICVDEVKASAGDLVEISVCIFNNPGINGAQIDISYDTDLGLVDVQNGKALKSLNFTSPGDYSNPSKFLWDGINENENGNGVALILKFKVPSNAKSGDKFNVSVTYPEGAIYDAELNDVKFDTVNGSITIK